MSIRMLRLILSGMCVAGFLTGGASAQGVDRYEFNEMKKTLQAMEAEVGQMRNALAGGALTTRLNAMEDELQRITAQLEQVQFEQRKQADAAKLKFEDLEYRIIELEGGDPSILFQNDEPQQGGGLAPSNAPVTGSPAPSSGGTLGTLNSVVSLSGPEKAEFDAAVAAIDGGRSVDGRSMMEGFLSSHPGSVLAGDAYYWLGESFFATGDYQSAASRYLDGATLYPNGPRAPDSLLKLGMTLNLMGRADIACQTLREVAARYPNAVGAAQQATLEANNAGCS